MKTKGNNLADATAKQAATCSQIVQTWESFYAVKSIKDYLLQFQRTAAKEEKKVWQQKVEILTKTDSYGFDLIRNQSYLLIWGLKHLYFNISLS